MLGLMANQDIIISFILHQQTPLHIAAREGNSSTVKLLVDKGAKHIKDKDGVSETQYFTVTVDTGLSSYLASFSVTNKRVLYSIYSCRRLTPRSIV